MPANTDFTEVIVTTLRNRSGMLADNVTNHNALLRKIDAKGNRKSATGRSIVEELDYAENSTVASYSGYDVIDTTPQDVISAAEFDWKQIAGTVVFNGLEKVKNSGHEAVINWIAARLKNLERSLKNELATQMYGDGTGNGSKDIGGLQLLIADDPTTGSVGGIDRANHTFWRNQLYDFSVNSATPGSHTIQTAMNKLHLACVRGSDAPDCWVADATYFEYYWSSLQAQQRITNDDKADAGFRSLAFLDASVFYDDQCPASHMYALNTDFLRLRYSEAENFTPGTPREAPNQNATITPVFWAGNLTLSNAARQGVIIA